MWDILLLDCHVASMTSGAPFGAIRDAALAIRDGRIAWVGAAKDRPSTAARETRRLDGAWITPGLIDCHTHLVFGGNRVREWDMRRNGATYEQIAAAGGGIISTVKATRECSEDELALSAALRARAMARRNNPQPEAFRSTMPNSPAHLRARAAARGFHVPQDRARRDRGG